MTQVIPSTIPSTKDGLEKEMKFFSSFARLVQIDISDGLFTGVKTWPYNGQDKGFFDDLTEEKVGWPQWENLDVEVHLMINSPEEVVEKWVRTGVVSVVAHIEATDNFQKIIDMCRESTVAVGVAIKPSTDISKIAPFVEHVDFIQCMGSNILGKHNTDLDPNVISKIKKLHELYPERIIGIDIGVTEDTAQAFVDAGAFRLISGSAILESGNPKETFAFLESVH